MFRPLITISKTHTNVGHRKLQNLNVTATTIWYTGIAHVMIQVRGSEEKIISKNGVSDIPNRHGLHIRAHTHNDWKQLNSKRLLIISFGSFILC